MAEGVLAAERADQFCVEQPLGRLAALLQRHSKLLLERLHETEIPAAGLRGPLMEVIVQCGCHAGHGDIVDLEANLGGLGGFLVPEPRRDGRENLALE